MQQPITEELLRLLSVLYRTQSLSLSASRLDISLSTASRMLQGARELFDDKLFTRSSQLMHPTPRMDKLMPQIDRMLEDMAALVGKDALDPMKAERTIRIAALDCAYTMFVAPAIHEARRKSPRLHFSTTPIGIDTFDELSAGLVDLIIFGTDSEPVQGNIHVQRLFSAPYCLVVRESHPLVEIFKQKGRLDRTDIEPWQVISIATPFSRLVPRSVLPWFDDAEQPHGITIPYHAAAIFELFETDLIGEFAEPYARKILSLVPGLALLPFEGFTTYQWAPTLFWHPRAQQDPVMVWLRGLIGLEARRIRDKYHLEA